MKTLKYSYLLIFLLFFISCETNSDEVQPTATLEINISHLVNGEPVVFNTKRYFNAVGNEYNILEFKYFLSNVKLRNRTTGALYLVPESYYLVEPTENEHIVKISIPGIPKETFNELEFALGVDNSKNYSIDNIGALDPSSNMAWDWNTGYKFLLLEGKFFPANSSETRGLIYHIGSDANYRILKFPFAAENQNSIVFNANAMIKANFEVEISEIFRTPTEVDFETHNVVMFEAFSRNIADNYANNMFKFLNAVVE